MTKRFAQIVEFFSTKNMTKIMSQKDAVHVAAGRCVLMMNSPAKEVDDRAMERVNKIRAEAADCLYFEFHDIVSPRPWLVHPEFHHVEKALAWAKDKDLNELICVCQMGVSRSSAMAYILNTAVNGPYEAIKVLDPKIHMPNRLIVAMGADLIAGNKPHEIHSALELETAQWWRKMYWPTFGMNEYARLIMQVYREYVARVDEMYAAEVPLEVIDYSSSDTTELQAKLEELPSP